MSEFMSKDNMMEVCGAHAAIERDPRRYATAVTSRSKRVYTSCMG
jgi:hypothetical protein